jgi:hypothetical protein
MTGGSTDWITFLFLLVVVLVVALVGPIVGLVLMLRARQRRWRMYLTCGPAWSLIPLELLWISGRLGLPILTSEGVLLVTAVSTGTASAWGWIQAARMAQRPATVSTVTAVMSWAIVCLLGIVLHSTFA